MSDLFWNILFFGIAYVSGFCFGRCYEIWKGIRRYRQAIQEKEVALCELQSDPKPDGEDDQISIVE